MHNLRLNLLLGMAYLLLSGFNILVDTHPAALWPAAGLTAYALLVHGARVLPGLYIAALITHLLCGGHLSGAIIEASGLTLSALACAHLLPLLLGERSRAPFGRVRDSVLFVLLLGGVFPLLATATTLYAHNLTGPVGPIAFQLFVGLIGGSLLIAPPLIARQPSALSFAAEPGGSGATMRERAGLILVLLLSALLSLAMPESTHGLQEALLALTALLLPWIALRLALHETLSLLGTLYLIGLAGTLAGHGPFAVEGGLLRFQMLSSGLAVMVMTLGALQGERLATLRELRRLTQDLDRRVRERTAELQMSRTRSVRQLRRLEATMTALPVALFHTDGQGRLVAGNPAFERLTGQAPEGHLPACLQPLLSADVLQGPSEMRIDCGFGERDMLVSLAEVHDETGQASGRVGVLQDITTQHDLQQRLDLTQHRASAALDLLPVPVLLLELDSACLRTANPEALRLLDAQNEAVDGLSLREFIAENASLQRLLAPLREGLPVHDIELSLTRRDGFESWVLASATPWLDSTPDGQTPLGLLAFRDISDLHRQREELQRLSVVDALTGIFNRREIMQTGDRELARALRQSRPLSVLVIDVDDFRRINDTHGFDTGDKVLVELTRVLSQVLRESDLFARIGGEEFAVVLPETGFYEAIEVAERMRDVAGRMRVRGRGSAANICPSISLGSSTWRPGDPAPKSFEDLLSRADRALFVAKEAGYNRIHAETLAA